MFKLLVLALLAVATIRAGYYEEMTARQLPEIGKRASTWKAGYNRGLANKSKDELKRLVGTKMDKKFDTPIVYPKIEPSGAVPDTFDARQQWPQCTLIGYIRDQGDCGSCWAVSSSAAMSDRTCIKTGQVPYLSDEDVMACCTSCGSGCDGGYPLMAWQWWTKTGVVTGGIYDSHQGCQPYEIAPTGTSSATPQQPENTPACQKSCETGYGVTYTNDKHKGSTYYQVGNGVSGMQQELFTNGPIVSAFSVYEDFYNYVSGVYQHKYGAYVGGHAVKVVGWGTEDNTPYWLVANSWNATWGMDGFFKIIRGTNDCGFESSISAGLD